MRKSIIVLLSILTVSFSLSAQYYPIDARIHSLGGTFIFNDMTDILRYPSFMTDYTNDAQVTFNSPILGVKSIGDVVSLGIAANRGLMLNTAFYLDAGRELRAAGIAFVPGAFGAAITTQNIPHVLLGLNLSALRLGFDMFLEYTRFSLKIEDNPNAGAATLTEAHSMIYHPGLIASANFGSEDVPFSIKLGGGLPRISGKESVNGATVEEVNSDEGYFATGGFEIGFPAGNSRWTTGATLLMENYQFDNITSNLLGPRFTNARGALYLGFEADVYDQTVLGLLYDFQVLDNREAPTPDGYVATLRANSDVILNHILSTGIEKKWENIWFFDSLQARGGLVYTISTPYAFSNGDDNAGSYDSRIKSEAAFGPFEPRIGLGASKGPFQLDLSVNLATWTGLVTGPAVALATAGIRF